MSTPHKRFSNGYWISAILFGWPIFCLSLLYVLCMSGHGLGEHPAALLIPATPLLNVSLLVLFLTRAHTRHKGIKVAAAATAYVCALYLEWVLFFRLIAADEPLFSYARLGWEIQLFGFPLEVFL